jgi:hypothetical protein
MHKKYHNCTGMQQKPVQKIDLFSGLCLSRSAKRLVRDYEFSLGKDADSLRIVAEGTINLVKPLPLAAGPVELNISYDARPAYNHAEIPVTRAETTAAMFAGLSKTQSFTIGSVALVLGTLAIGWLGKSMIDGETPGELQFWHAGYYRDDSMNRLFTIAFLPTASRADVERYADQLTYTPGHTTAAFFYPEGSMIPSASITDAGNLADAKQALRTMTGASPWRFAALKDETGALRLVDCEMRPNDPLCRY